MTPTRFLATFHVGLWLACVVPMCIPATAQDTATGASAALPDVFGSAPESTLQELPDVFQALPASTDPHLPASVPGSFKASSDSTPKPDPRDAQIAKLLGAIEAQSQRIDRLSEMLAAPNPQAIESAPPLQAPALPIMFMYSMPISEGKCPPCENGQAAITKAAARLPFKLEVRTDVHLKSYPLFVWLDAAANRRELSGWHGLDRLLMEFYASMVSPAAKQQRQAAAPATSTWEKIANSPGRTWGEGDRGQFPTRREHLRDEHGVPMEATRGMNQRQLDRIHGFKHDGASLDNRIRRRAMELCQIEYRSKKVSACVPGAGLPVRSQAKSGNVNRELSGSVPACC